MAAQPRLREKTRRETASGRSRSRGHYISEEYAVRFGFVNQILEAFQVHPQSTIDGFAGDSNHGFSNYYTFDRQGPWESTMWLNPPWSKWSEVASRVLQSDCACICICPFWGTIWLLHLLLATSCCLFFNRGVKFFELDGVECAGTHWSVLALYIPAGKKFGAMITLPKSVSQKRRLRRKKCAGGVGLITRR